MEPLTREEMARLEALAAGPSKVLQRRARLILLAAEGLPPAQIASQVGLSRRRIYHWRREFRLRRMAIFGKTTTRPAVPPEPVPESVSEPAAAAPSEPLTPEALAQQHQLDLAQGQRVADVAALIFDATDEIHQLDAARRFLLQTACLLNSLKPDQVAAQPLAGWSSPDQAILAALLALRRKAAHPKKEPAWLNLPADSQREALALAAILRLAIRLGDTELDLAVIDGNRVELSLAAGPKKLKSVSAEAGWWASVFGTELIVQPGGRQRSLSDWTLDAPELTARTPASQAARTILVFYLERIPRLVERLRSSNSDSGDDLARTIRSARQVLRSMGGLFDMTDLASIPKQLRWLRRQIRPLQTSCVMTSHLEGYLAASHPRAPGVEAMRQKWDAEHSLARAELLQTLSNKRYRDFVNAIQTFIKTENAGIFGKKAAHRQQLGDLIPGLVQEPFHALGLASTWIEKWSDRQVREARRQVRALYFLLAHFQSVLGVEAASCRQTLLTVEDHLNYYTELGLVLEASSQFLQRSQEQEESRTGCEAFIAAKEAERSDLQGRLPTIWQTVVAKRFERHLNKSTAKLA